MRGRVVVAKVGGSLLGWPPLPGRLAGFLAERGGRRERVVLIAGGGGAADWVREFDLRHAPGDEVAHALAVRSLDLTAHALAALVAGSEVVESLAAVEGSWGAGLMPILAPRLVLGDDDRTSPDPLPRNWDATTDAISARVATLLNADELALLKSAGAAPGTTRAEASRIGLVDPTFPLASRGLASVVVVNFRDDPPSTSVLI